MGHYVVWLLLSISTGSYSSGVATVISQHPTEADCMHTYTQIHRTKHLWVHMMCVEAKVVAVR